MVIPVIAAPQGSPSEDSPAAAAAVDKSASYNSGSINSCVSESCSAPIPSSNSSSVKKKSKKASAKASSGASATETRSSSISSNCAAVGGGSGSGSGGKKHSNAKALSAGASLMALPDDVLNEVLSYLKVFFAVAPVSKRLLALTRTPAIIRAAIKHAPLNSACAVPPALVAARVRCLEELSAEQAAELRGAYDSEVLHRKWLTTANPNRIYPSQFDEKSEKRSLNAAVRRARQMHASNLQLYNSAAYHDQSSPAAGGAVCDAPTSPTSPTPRSTSQPTFRVPTSIPARETHVPVATWLDDGAPRCNDATMLLFKASERVGIRVRNNKMVAFWLSGDSSEEDGSSSATFDAEELQVASAQGCMSTDDFYPNFRRRCMHLSGNFTGPPPLALGERRANCSGLAPVATSGVITSITTAFETCDRLTIAVQTPWNIELWTVDTRSAATQPPMAHLVSWYLPNVLHEAISRDPVYAHTDASNLWLRHVPLSFQANCALGQMFLVYGDMQNDAVKIACFDCLHDQLFSGDQRQAEVAYCASAVLDVPGRFDVALMTKRGFGAGLLLRMRDRACFDTSGVVGGVIDDALTVHVLSLKTHTWSSVPLVAEVDYELTASVPVVQIRDRIICTTLVAPASATSANFLSSNTKGRVALLSVDDLGEGPQIFARTIPIAGLQHVTWDAARLYTLVYRTREARHLIVYSLASLSVRPNATRSTLRATQFPTLVPSQFVREGIVECNSTPVGRNAVFAAVQQAANHGQQGTHDRQALINLYDRVTRSSSIAVNDLNTNFVYSAIVHRANGDGIEIIETLIHATSTPSLFRSRPPTAASSAPSATTSLPSPAPTLASVSPSLSPIANVRHLDARVSCDDDDDNNTSPSASPAPRNVGGVPRPSAGMWVRRTGDVSGGAVSVTSVDRGANTYRKTVAQITPPTDLTAANCGARSAPRAIDVASIQAAIQPLQWCEYLRSVRIVL